MATIVYIYTVGRQVAYVIKYCNYLFKFDDNSITVVNIYFEKTKKEIIKNNVKL